MQPNVVHMQHPSTQDTFYINKLCCVTVTFHPDFEQLKAQLSALPENYTKVIVDNASGIDTFTELKQLISLFQNTFLLENNHNVGLGAAINQGVNFAASLPQAPEFILLLDQDSIPEPDSTDRLLQGFLALHQQGRKVGCVGPLLLDITTGLTHGFHQSTNMRWKRFYPSTEDSTPVPCANINGSGTLVPLSVFQSLGGLDDQLFIDHIDTEWSFRLVSKGYELWGIPNAIFQHSMGENSLKFWCWGWKVWPVRSPLRHQYLFRNAILLMRRSYIPNVWKFWAIIKLCLTFLVVSLFDQLRSQQIKNMLLGIKKGISHDNKS